MKFQPIDEPSTVQRRRNQLIAVVLFAFDTDRARF
jgi:hypothetical protein